MHLLAHEVAHTQQQAGGSGGGAQLKGLDVSMPGDASEVEADRAADAMVRGEAATVSAAGAGVQRFFGLFDDDEEGGGGGTTQDAVAEPAKKKADYLVSYLKGRAFPWDLLQPEAKGKKRLTRQIIEDWLTFYQLVVYGAPFPDRRGLLRRIRSSSGGRSAHSSRLSLVSFRTVAEICRIRAASRGRAVANPTTSAVSLIFSVLVCVIRPRSSIW